MTPTETPLQAAIARHQSGDLTAALQEYQTILLDDPCHADAWHLCGVAALQCGQPDQAVAHIRRAIEFRLDQPEYFTNLATAHLQRGDLPSADAASTAALHLAPASPAAHFRRGKVLAALGQTEQALEHFGHALDAGFSPAVTLMEIGGAYRAIGSIAECLRAYREAATLADDPIPALAQLAHLASQGHGSLTTTDWRQLLFAVEQGTQHGEMARRATRAAFAVASFMESDRRFQQAFELFSVGNQLSQRYLEPRVPADWIHRRQMHAERQRCSYDRAALRNLDHDGHPSRRPIFVVGLPRSGTSLLAQILAAHSQVGSAGELKTLARISADYPSDRDATSIPSADDRQEMARRYLLELEAYDHTSTHVVDKMPGNSVQVGLIHALFPHAPVIWCRRDPRDIALSCFGTLFESDHLQFETSRWDRLVALLQLHSNMREHWHEVLPGRVYEVSYEDLTSHPERTIRRLLEACSLPWEPACLTPELNRSAVHTASSLQVREPIHRRSQGRWERYRQWVESPLAGLEEHIRHFEPQAFQHPQSAALGELGHP